MLSALALGALDGLTIAILAVGLVLVFRGKRFVNFAQAQLGIIPMLLLGKLVLDHGANWWFACVFALVLGALIGAATELLVIRPLTARGPFTMLVATIGVSQLLIGFSYFTWLAPDPAKISFEGYPVPFVANWQVSDSLSLYTDRILTLILVPVVTLALAVFLKFTRTGKAIRAAASNPTAASLAGLPTGRLALITWAIAGALSTLAAVLYAPSQGSFVPQSFGPSLLLPALAAAAFGAFTSIPLTFAAAIGLGVVQAGTVYVTHDGTSGSLALFVAVLIGVVLRARAIGASGAGGADGRSQVEAVHDMVARIPDSLRNRFWVRRSGAMVAVVTLAVALAMPFLFNTPSSQFRLGQILVTTLLVVSLTVLAGWAGQLSLGQYAFAGLGGFVAGQVLVQYWSLPAALIMAGVVGFVASMIVGLPALRYRGLTLSVTTLAVAVVAPAWLFQQTWLWPDGYTLGSGLVLKYPAMLGNGGGQIEGQRAIYFVALGVVVVVVAALAALRRSVAGSVLLAVRDNEDAAASVGIRPAITKLSIFGLVGFIAGVAGVLDILVNLNLTAGRYVPDFSLLIVSIAVIGGLGSISGAILSSLLIFGIPLLISDWTTSWFPAGNQLPLLLGGALLILNLLALPGGLHGEVVKAWSAILRRADRKARRGAVVSEESDAATATFESGGLRAGRVDVRSRPSVFDGAHRGTAGDADSPALRVENLSVRFGELTAVNNVSIEIARGEIVGLIGNNGAGKTTLINAISGRVRAHPGAVEILGVDATRMSSSRRASLGLGRTFQDAHLYPGLTGRQILEVAMAGRYGRPSIAESLAAAPWVARHGRLLRAEADEILARLGLSEYADVAAVNLSTGLRRVMDLAIQLAIRPGLILLDEPTAGLAQAESEAFVPLLRSVATDLGASILIVEHDMPVILSVTDRIYCLELGQVIAEGTPEETRHNQRVIESYLGTADGTGATRSGPLGADALVSARGAE
ncbi:ATP-binding cassette domain-containing protein [Nocardioides sp. WS12]|uniref:ABC transporter permease subunit n=1 Tax=Nocardioides sp. WS12 TaxID=2486272 RepID=UPI0015FA5D74|nr:ATP-binding cassette domain-containing protein [Nocardioides sp. WS12]